MADHCDLARLFKRIDFDDLGHESLDDDDWLLIHESVGTSASGWAQVLDESRAVIVASGGSGKSAELERAATRLHEQGRHAFFLRLEELRGRSLEDVLRRRDLTEPFERWQGSNAPAWWLLDSRDELALGGGELDEVLRTLADGVGSARDRLNVVLSSRASDWKARADARCLVRALPVAAPTTAPREQGTATGPGAPLGTAQRPPPSVPNSSAPDSSVALFQLLPLTRAHVRRLAGYWQVGDVRAFLAAMDRGAGGATRYNRPLALRTAVEQWKATGSLGTVYRQMQRLVKRMIEDSDSVNRGDHELVQLVDGAGRLALGLVLTRARALYTGPLTAAPPDGTDVIDTARLLGAWSPIDRAALLRTGLFEIAGPDEARFRDREVREFLAAEHLRTLLARGLAAVDVRTLLFAERYGEALVRPSMRGIAAWLGAREPSVRDEILRRDGGVLVSGGDPGSLPREVRRALLRAGVERLAGAVARNGFTDTSRWAELVGDDLFDEVSALWDCRRGAVAVRRPLLALVGALGSRECVGLVLPLLDPGPEELDTALAVHAAMACGASDAVRERLGALVPRMTRWAPANVRRVVRELFPAMLSASELVKLLSSSDSDGAFDGFDRWLDAAFADIDPSSAKGETLRDAVTTALLDRLRSRTGADGVEPERSPVCAAALVAHCVPGLERPALVSRPEFLSACIVGATTAGRRSGHDAPVARLRAAFAAATPEVRRRTFLVAVDVEQGLGEPVYVGDPTVLRHGGWRVFDFTPERDLDWLCDVVADGDAPLLARELALSRALGLAELAGTDEQVEQSLALVVQEQDSLKRIVGAWRASREGRRRFEVEAAAAATRSAPEIPAETWEQWDARVRNDPAGAVSSERVAATMINLARRRVPGPDADTGDGAGDRIHPAVLDAFGAEARQVLVAAAATFWRTHRPSVRSGGAAGPGRGWQVVDLAGLVALRLDQRVGDVGRVLSDAEAARVIDYGLLCNRSSLDVLEPLLDGHEDLLVQALASELERQVASPPELDGHRLARSLSEAPDALIAAIAPRLDGVLDQVCTLDASTLPDDGASAALRVRLEALGRLAGRCAAGDRRESLIRLSRERLAGTRDPLQVCFWTTLLARLDPLALADVLERVADSDHLESTRLELVVSLFDEQTGAIDVEASGDVAARAELAAALYRIACRLVPPIDDVPFGAVEGDSPRERAQRARHVLFERLASVPGGATYAALKRLSSASGLDVDRGVLERAARRRAERDADTGASSADATVQILDELRAVPSDVDTLFPAMVEAVEQVKRFYLHGRLSNRAVLREQAHEESVQIDLASRLDAARGSRFEVVIEDQTARHHRLDIRLLSGAGSIQGAIEIKLYHRWTPAELEERLRNQLLGQYLDETQCPIGLFVVVRTLPAARNFPGTRRRASFDAIMDRLQGVADDIVAAHDYVIRLRVIGIDLQEPA